MLSYDLFRKHESLKDKTPAEVAKVHAPFRSWEEAVEWTGPKRAVAKVEVVAAPKQESSGKGQQVVVDTEKILGGLKPTPKDKPRGDGSRAKATATPVKTRSKKSSKAHPTAPYRPFMRRLERRRRKR